MLVNYDNLGADAMRSANCLLVFLLLGGQACADDAEPAWLQELSRRAAAFRPSAQELRWMAIPWQNSALDAERLARQTQRPILYWNVDDDPLDRC